VNVKVGMPYMMTQEEKITLNHSTKFSVTMCLATETPPVGAYTHTHIHTHTQYAYIVWLQHPSRGFAWYIKQAQHIYTHTHMNKRFNLSKGKGKQAKGKGTTTTHTHTHTHTHT